MERLWSLATWLAARRKLKARPDDVRRQEFRGQTRGMGLRMSAALRDRLRPRWLRLRAQTDPRGAPPAQDGGD